MFSGLLPQVCSFMAYSLSYTVDFQPRSAHGAWESKQITRVSALTEPQTRPRKLYWTFYLWEDRYHVLALQGAEWNDYSWKGQEVLSSPVHFTADSETAITHATAAGRINALYYKDAMWFYFRGTNGLIYECVRSGPDWRLFDLTFQLRAQGNSITPVRPSSTDLAVLAEEDTVHIFFIGLDMRLRELYKTAKRPWKHVSLRRHVGSSVCSLPAQDQPRVCANGKGRIHVFFINEENRIGECYWRPKSGKWRATDTSEFIPRHGPVTSLMGIDCADGPHFFMATKDGKDHRLTYRHVYWAKHRWATGIWSSTDLTASDVEEPNDDDDEEIFDERTADTPASSNPSSGVPSPPPPPPAPVKTATGQSVGEKMQALLYAPKKPLVVTLPMKPVDLTDCKPVRLVLVSDTHNFADRVGTLPAGDILIHCGDCTVYGKGDELREFATWLDAQTQFRHKVVIAGNHEVNPGKAKALLEKRCCWLDDKLLQLMGLKFYGTTWGADYTKLPTEGVDILLTHKPPAGHGDIVFTGESRGSQSLAKAVHVLKPIIHAFGHNHEGFGATSDAHTVYINAATCLGNAKSKMRRGSIVVDIYPQLKHKYGSIQPGDANDLSSSILSSDWTPNSS